MMRYLGFLLFLNLASLDDASKLEASASNTVPLKKGDSIQLPVTKSPDFNREVRPILESSCISCHGINEQKGGLRLDTLSHSLRGGESGPSIVSGEIRDSILLERIHLPSEDMEAMPPEGKSLSDPQKKILSRWIENGANWPDGVQLKQFNSQQLSLREKADKKEVVSLVAYPQAIALDAKHDFQSLIIVD